MRLLLIGAALAVMGGGWLLRRPEPVHFRNGGLVQARGLQRFLYRSRTQKETADLVNAADRSVLIRDLSVVNSPPDGFTFQQLVRGAMASGADVDGAFLKLVDTSVGFGLLGRHWKLQGSQTLATIPLRLLAVVNRADLGMFCAEQAGCKFDGIPCPYQNVCRAEVRFVYAGAEAQGDIKPYFMGILEFTLPALTQDGFKTLVGRWMSLQTYSATDFPAQLAGVLQYCWGLKGSDGSGLTARFRFNGRTQDGVWALTEIPLSGATGLVAEPLFEQFDQGHAGQCQRKGPLFDFAANPTEKDVITNGQYDLKDEGAATSAFQFDLHSQLLTFGPPVTEEIRHSLSLNSCTGCHTWETRLKTTSDFEPFDQIQYREGNAESQLSAFLTGNSDGKPSGAITMAGWRMTPQIVPCGANAQEITHNELLRRVTFLQQVQGLKGRVPDSAWLAIFGEFGDVRVD
jgi:hypothetical protein